MSDCNSMDCSLPGSSVHGISQARILEWVAIFSSRGSSQPRDWICVSCIAGGFFFFFFFLTTEPLGSPWETLGYIIFKISFSFQVACFCECTKSHWIVHFKRKEFSPSCYVKIFFMVLEFSELWLPGISAFYNLFFIPLWKNPYTSLSIWHPLQRRSFSSRKSFHFPNYGFYLFLSFKSLWIFIPSISFPGFSVYLEFPVLFCVGCDSLQTCFYVYLWSLFFWVNSLHHLLLHSCWKFFDSTFKINISLLHLLPSFI